jgi:hypothetical protein
MGAAMSHQESPSLHDVDESQEYRSLSIPALISLLLGLASVLSLVHVILIAIPLIGLATSAVALLRTRTTATSGRSLALIGLALSTFFAAFAVSQYTASQAILRNFAQRAAGQWIALVQAGRLHEAHQWSLSVSLRMERDDLLEAYYEEHLNQKHAMNEMFQRSGLRELVQLGKNGVVRRTGGRQVHQDRSQQIFEFDYLVTGPQIESPFQLLVTRRWNLDYLRYDWIVGPVPEKE